MAWRSQRPAATMADERASLTKAGADRARWAWVIALAFVTITLIALVVIPILVQRRVNRLRTSIQSSEPARTLLMSLQFNLVREMSTLNQYALRGDPELVPRFRAARAAERDIWNDLAPLATNLGTTVHEQFVEARTVAQLWHQRLNEEELLRRRGLERLEASDMPQRFEEVLIETAQLDSVIILITQKNRADIQAAERTGLQFTLLSGVLALIAAAVVAALVVRIGRLAQEAERGRRQASAALARSAQEIETRRRFLRGVTHDVKNPLGAARGYAELLRMGLKGPLNPEQMKLAEGVDRSIDSALAIISDLLDLARADSGGIVVRRMNIDLNEIARQAADDHRGAAEAAGHTIELHDGQKRVECYTDPGRVRQILDNLISNAIKYTTPPGHIVIRTETEAADAPFAHRAVALRVSDNGPGIPSDQRERIFDEFTRVDDKTPTKGHGLGLAIARRLARLLDGELGLADHSAPGATFVLWLPLREQREQPRDTTSVSE